MKKTIKKAIIGAVATVSILAMSTKVLGTTGKVTEATVRIRETASTESSTVILISVDTEVEIEGTEREWYKVVYKESGKTYKGYIRKDMLNVEGQEQKPQETENSNSENTTKTETSNENSENANNVANATNENTENTNETTEETKKEITEGYEETTTGKIEIKILPKISSSKIGEIGANTKIKVTQIMNKWAYIESDSISGWTLKSKIEKQQVDETKQEEKPTVEENKTTENTPVVEEAKKEEEKPAETNTTTEAKAKATTKTMYVDATTVNIREKADSNAKIILQLSRNTKVTVIEVVDKTWSKVQVNGKTGYVASKFLSETKTQEVSTRSEETARSEASKSNTTASSTTSSSTTQSSEKKEETSTTQASSVSGANVVVYAKQYLGYRYVSGGSSPSTGFDCSGFTSYIYKHFGISLSRTSGGQSSNGTAVPKSSLQAGDLVIFNNSGNTKVGHVGIYIGGNSFIHASTPSTGVIISSLSESYYAKRYVSARRVL